MLCFRVSLRGEFLGLVHKDDSATLRGMVNRFGISSLEMVPVVVL